MITPPAVIQSVSDFTFYNSQIVLLKKKCRNVILAIFANFEAIRVKKAQITKEVFKIQYKSVLRLIFSHISESRYSSFF
jgi:hypothetical protein